MSSTGYDALEAFLYRITRDCGFGVVNEHIRDLCTQSLTGFDLTDEHGAAQAVTMARQLRAAIDWDASDEEVQS